MVVASVRREGVVVRPHRRGEPGGDGLLADGVDEATLAGIEAAAATAVSDAEAIARDAPEPDPDSLTTQVWADGGSSWRN